MLDRTRKFKWTDENVAVLQRMVKEGASASEAGIRLGCSRNAAVGKANRLGMAFHSDLRKRTKTYSESIRAALGKARGDKVQIKALKVKLAEPEPEVIEIPIHRNIGLLELTESTCKWPVGDPLEEGFGFCGTSSRIGSSYCAYHGRIAYRPRNEAINIGGRHK